MTLAATLQKSILTQWTILNLSQTLQPGQAIFAIWNGQWNFRVVKDRDRFRKLHRHLHCTFITSDYIEDEGGVKDIGFILEANQRESEYEFLNN